MPVLRLLLLQARRVKQAAAQNLEAPFLSQALSIVGRQRICASSREDIISAAFSPIASCVIICCALGSRGPFSVLLIYGACKTTEAQGVGQHGAVDLRKSTRLALLCDRSGRKEAVEIEEDLQKRS